MAKNTPVTKTDPVLAALIRISRTVGKDSSLVQGGGGNTSVKSADGEYMFIKASGTALKDMTKEKGWRRLKLSAIWSIIKDRSLAKFEPAVRETEVVNRLFLACDDNLTTGARPSVETPLHAILDRCVIHLHPSVVGVYVNAKKGKVALEKVFKNEKYPPLWVPYVNPGLTLARKTARLVSDYQNRYGRKPTVLFLEKHGLFISAGTPAAGLSLVHKVTETCNRGLKKTKRIKIKPVTGKEINEARLCLRRAFFAATGQYTPVNFFMDETIAGFSARKDAKNLLGTAPITPDELVYARGPAMWVEKCDLARIIQRLKSQISREQKPPAAFLVKNLGLFILGKEKTVSVIKDILLSSFFIRAQAKDLGGIASLNRYQADFINHWEAEAFRRSLVSASALVDLKDRIAVISGAGSGLGRSIAIGLARAGVLVGLADIDQEAAQQTSQIIKDECPEASTLILGSNVTDETDVDNTFNFLLNNWGGLDILVNAAGIAPAYPLIELPADKWRAALEINLTGYFLMARAAARIMIQQQMGGVIINISSKSGLDASKNNTPYNATKAGELHMARGWAMELGRHNIRVNSICPGNVFERSKIWSPAYIKVCAKKYGIKPEEVIPYYVNKTMLKKEIKGQDIADAVVFLASDKARRITAQTLVVDAGQAMVR